MSEEKWIVQPCEYKKDHFDLKQGLDVLFCIKAENARFDAKERLDFIALACNTHKDMANRLFNSEKYIGGHKKNCCSVHYGATDARGVCDCGFDELETAVMMSQEEIGLCNHTTINTNGTCKNCGIDIDHLT